MKAANAHKFRESARLLIRHRGAFLVLGTIFIYCTLTFAGSGCGIPTNFISSEYNCKKLTDISKATSELWKKSNNSGKIIVVWTKIFGKRFVENHVQHCGKLKDVCFFTANRKLINAASAVVFHVWPSDLSLSDLPLTRRPNQRYVFMTMEVPPTHRRRYISSLPAYFFNWTLTYRRDSDVPLPYGGSWTNPNETKHLGMQPEVLPYDRKSIMEGKKSSIFWLVSNCHTVSKRELAVKKLSKYIPVELYGKCAKTKTKKRICSRRGDCEKKLAQENYFFIAVENAVCKDYFSEKYWERYALPSVPIFMKRHVYDRFLPPKSFIAMDDFEGAKTMASFLSYLMMNETAYLEYFAWRAEGWGRPGQIEGYRSGWCGLCEKLMEDKKRKSIKSIEKWFYGTSECERDEFARNWEE